MPKLGMPEIRRPQLIDATMSVIDDVGLSGASVSLISKKAGVSTGIINHYFGGKHGLLEATMRTVLRQLGTIVQNKLRNIPDDQACARILAIVEGNFDQQQMESKVVKTWLAFWTQSMHDPVLYRIQRVNACRLVSHLTIELKKIRPHAEAKHIAETIAALIDGIWLRGALSPNGMDPELACQQVKQYLEKQLD
jgi:TetR/AcrR family transcriptional repressor of bet genes